MKRRIRYRVAPDITIGPAGLIIGQKKKKQQDSTNVMIGKLNEQGPAPQVWWSFESECVLGILGKRGTGKSYTLGVFLEGLGCRDSGSGIGFNTGDRSVLVFDTLNIFQHSVVPVGKIHDEELRNESVKLLVGCGFGEEKVSFHVSYPAGEKLPFYPDIYEPFAIDTSLIRPEDYGHIFDIEIYKEPMGHLLLAAYDAVKFSGYHSAGNGIEGSATAGLKELIDLLSTENDVCEGFSGETVRALLARFRSLYQMEMFSGVPTTVHSLLSNPGVRILLMGQLSPPLRSVVAALLIRQIFNMRSASAEATKMLRLHSSLDKNDRKEAEKILAQSPHRVLICIDEIQGYAPPSKTNPCTEVLVQFVKEGRNHGLSLLCTSQQPGAIHNEVLSQMDGIICHQLSMQSDIEAVLRHAKGTSPEKISTGKQSLSEVKLLRQLAQGTAWVSHSDAQRAFILDVRPRITAHGGIEL